MMDFTSGRSSIRKLVWTLLFRFQNPQKFGTILVSVPQSQSVTSESPHEWILKRRHEDLSLTVRASWSLYIQFYTVFLTVSVIGLGWVLTRPADAQIVPRAKHVIAIVFVIQTLLTAITSGAMALYTMRVEQHQERIENLLVQSHLDALPSVGPALPASLARWAGWFNCAAMIAMAALWLYVGFY
jgi:hypothetical protein